MAKEEITCQAVKRVWDETRDDELDQPEIIFEDSKRILKEVRHTHKVSKIDARSETHLLTPHPGGVAQHEAFTLDLTEIYTGEKSNVLFRRQIVAVPANVLHPEELALCTSYASFLTYEMTFDTPSDHDVRRAINFLFVKEADMTDEMKDDPELMRSVRQLGLAEAMGQTAKNNLHAHFFAEDTAIVGTVRYFVYCNKAKKQRV